MKSQNQLLSLERVVMTFWHHSRLDQIYITLPTILEHKLWQWEPGSFLFCKLQCNITFHLGPMVLDPSSAGIALTTQLPPSVWLPDIPKSILGGGPWEQEIIWASISCWNWISKRLESIFWLNIFYYSQQPTRQTYPPPMDKKKYQG